MELYHGSISTKQGHDVLRHHGSLLASIQRVNSMYCTQNTMGFDGREFVVSNIFKQSNETISVEEAQQRFIYYIKQANFFAQDVDIKNPLRLFDCWQDDPIGSGAMGIFQQTDNLTFEQRADLEKLFRPFEKIIYPADVKAKLSDKSLKAIKRFVAQNAQAKEQFKHRKNRSRAIGEDFQTAAEWENVWIYFTIRLKDWALKNGFDSFVYQNNEEGDGADSYVTLRKSQSTLTQQYQFDMERYMDEIIPIFRQTLENMNSNGYAGIKPQDMGEKIYWAGKEPISFLKKIP